MDGFRQNAFVSKDSLTFDDEGEGVLTLAGEISCLGNIVIRVEKHLEIMEEDSPDPLVRTFDYAYNASVRGADTFVRYDNLHMQKGHRDPHHKHDIDWRNGSEFPYSPQWVGAFGWPTLSDFIEEVMGWYYRHMTELPDPDTYAEIDIRG